MAIGLDAGTMFFCSARRGQDGKITHIIERDVFVELPKNTDKAKSFMDKAGTQLVTIEGTNYVIGSKAEEFAQFLQIPYRRPLKAGLLNPDEDDTALTILREIMRGVAGKAFNDKEHLVYTIPANPVESGDDNTAHRDTLKWLLESLGYKNVTAVNEGVCALRGGLREDEAQSGIGISFGAGMANVAVVYEGFEIESMQFSVQRSGDWIDEKVARSAGCDKSEVIVVKESEFSLLDDNMNTNDKIKRNLHIYYVELINTVIDLIIAKFNENPKAIPVRLRASNKNAEKLPILLAGGTASPQGFANIFRDQIEKRLGSKEQFPFAVKSIRVTDDILYTVSRGALVYAESLEKSQ